MPLNSSQIKQVRILSMATVLIGFTAMLSTVNDAGADAKFRKWIDNFYSVAAKKGIKKRTYQQVFAGIKRPIPEVLAAANYQPEFKSKIWDYLDSRVRESIIRDGLEKKKQYRSWLDKIERKFGVDRHILLAIWSMESSFGEALENKKGIYPLGGALATLAYADKKRAKFARGQLIAALKIVQRGDISAKGLVGSWAGAMGHTQFIPTSYQAWAVDIDGNGRRDIWNSPPDALASAANLLKKNGWRSGKTWGYEVKVPAKLSTKKHANKTKTVQQWANLGVKRVKGRKFIRPKEKAVLKFPAGRKGPAFLMIKNFYVLKRYNNADKYAIAVGHLADRLRGGGEFVKPWPRGYTALNEKDRMKLQEHLARLGYYDSDIDGNIGSGSRAAIKAFQKRHNIKVDGYASLELLNKIKTR